MTYICNPRIPPIKKGDNTKGFVDHHFNIFPEVVVIEDSVSQFPEGCAGTAYTVLNFCFSGGLLG